MHRATRDRAGTRESRASPVTGDSDLSRDIRERDRGAPGLRSSAKKSCCLQKEIQTLLTNATLQTSIVTPSTRGGGEAVAPANAEIGHEQ